MPEVLFFLRSPNLVRIFSRTNRAALFLRLFLWWFFCLFERLSPLSFFGPRPKGQDILSPCRRSISPPLHSPRKYLILASSPGLTPEAILSALVELTVNIGFGFLFDVVSDIMLKRCRTPCLKVSMVVGILGLNSS